MTGIIEKYQTIATIMDYSPNAGPEKNLWMRYLQQAILDLVSPRKSIRKAARDFVFERISEEKPREFSFRWVCLQLDLNYDFLQEQLRVLPEKSQVPRCRKRIVNDEYPAFPEGEYASYLVMPKHLIGAE